MNGRKRLEGTWLGFSGDTPEERARDRFRQKYGREPERVVWWGRWLYAGPVGENGHNGHNPATSLLRRVEASAKAMTPERARQLILQLEVNDERGA